MEDGNWIRNIKFQFPVPILRDGKEVARVDGISLDNEQFDEHTVSLEKLSTLETVCLLSKLHEAKHHVNVKLDMDEMDLTAAESIHPQVAPAPQELQDKHYFRKHGANAYYGQN